MAKMPERLEQRQIWEAAHQNTPLSDQPEPGVLAFLGYIQPQLTTGTTLLDAGCGRGRNLPALAQAGFRLYACDLSRLALGIARARASEAGATVRLLAADLTSLPYVENSFTAAICVHVLPYHFKAGIMNCVQELWRVLRPDGWLYLDLLDCEDAEYGRGKKLEDHTFLDPDGIPLHLSSRQEVDELTKDFSWKQVTRHALKTSPARTRVAWSVWAIK